MNLNQRIESLVSLGSKLDQYLKSEAPAEEQEAFNQVVQLAENRNRWFTQDNVLNAVKAIQGWMTEDSLVDWMSNYVEQYDLEGSQKTVGIVSAGNIPLVGWHDVISVLITGNNVLLKPSSDDELLMKFVLMELQSIEPGFKDRIVIENGQLKGFDGIIATGSNNTARYFKQYFGKYPHIIRKNRKSLAVLTGEESDDELLALGQDIFQYYGRGCRNVSHILIPKDYDFDPFFKAMLRYEEVGKNHKYVNNLDYHKSIMLINKDPFLDGGILLVKKDPSLNAPVGVLNYQEYNVKPEVKKVLDVYADDIQCVVGKDQEYFDFGQAQNPSLMDYPDGVDIIQFLKEEV